MQPITHLYMEMFSISSFVLLSFNTIPRGDTFRVTFCSFFPLAFAFEGEEGGESYRPLTLMKAGPQPRCPGTSCEPCPGGLGIRPAPPMASAPGVLFQGCVLGCSEQT